MTLITWNSRRTNPTHTPAHSPLTLSTFSSDNIHKKQWQLSKETVTTLARNSDHVHTEKWQFPHRILTTFTWNSIHIESLLPTKQRSKHGLTFFPLTFEQLIFCCLALGDPKNPNRKSFLVGIKHLEMTSFTQILKTKCILGRNDTNYLKFSGDISNRHLLTDPVHPMSTFASDNFCKKQWKLSQQIVSIFTKIVTTFTRGSTTTFTRNSDTVTQWTFDGHRAEVGPAWPSFLLTILHLIFCCLTFGDKPQILSCWH